MDQMLGVTDQAAYDRLINGWREDISSALGAFAVEGETFPPTDRPYQIGAAAGPIWDVVFHVAEVGDYWIQAIDAYLGLGTAVIALMRSRHRRLVLESSSLAEADHLFGTVTITETMVQAMCAAHAHEHYYDPKRHPAFSFVTVTHESPFASKEHPTPWTRYTVAVNIGRSTYVYHCLSSGQIDSLLEIENGQTQVLQVPDLFGRNGPLG